MVSRMIMTKKHRIGILLALIWFLVRVLDHNRRTGTDLLSTISKTLANISQAKKPWRERQDIAGSFSPGAAAHHQREGASYQTLKDLRRESTNRIFALL